MSFLNEIPNDILASFFHFIKGTCRLIHRVYHTHRVGLTEFCYFSGRILTFSPHQIRRENLFFNKLFKFRITMMNFIPNVALHKQLQARFKIPDNLKII